MDWIRIMLPAVHIAQIVIKIWPHVIPSLICVDAVVMLCLLLLSPSCLPARYQKLLAGCSDVRLLDLKDMNSRVPLPQVPEANRPPAFVLGGKNDAVGGGV
jgi:hypothetical protein